MCPPTVVGKFGRDKNRCGSPDRIDTGSPLFSYLLKDDTDALLPTEPQQPVTEIQPDALQQGRFQILDGDDDPKNWPQSRRKEPDGKSRLPNATFPIST